MTPTDFTQRILWIAEAMQALANDMSDYDGYETRILRNNLASGASILRTKQVRVTAEMVLWKEPAA